LGNGDGTFQTAVNCPTGGRQPYEVSVGDLNGDGAADIVLIYNGTPRIYLNNGQGSFSAPVTLQSSPSISFLAIADCNGDGTPDLVLSAATAGVWVCMGNGGGGFQTPIFDSLPAVVLRPALADLDGDGKNDLVGPLSNGSGYLIAFGDGAGHFQNATVTTVAGLNGAGALVSDFNHDSKPDIAIVSPATSGSIAMNLGGRQFASPDFTFGTGSYGMCLATFQSSPFPELVLENQLANLATLVWAPIADGVHTITVRATDLSGNVSPPSAPLTIVIDTTPPQLTMSPVPIADGYTVMDHVQLTFHEPISGLNLSCLSLTLDGGPNLLTSDQTLVPTSANTWTLGNLAQLNGAPGTYSLTIVKPNSILDLAGNALAANPSVQWTSTPFTGSAGNDSFAFKADLDGRNVDVWVDASMTANPTFKVAANMPITLRGNGGNDTIVIDQTAGDVLGVLSGIDSSGGSIALKLIGTAGDDNVEFDDGRILFGTRAITLHDVSSIDYFDGGGEDNLSVNGSVPVNINFGDGSDLEDAINGQLQNRTTG